MWDKMVVVLLVVTNQADTAKAYSQGDRNQSGSINEWLIRPGVGVGVGQLRSDSKVCGLGNEAEVACDEIWNPGEDHFRKEMVSSVCGCLEFVVPVRLPSVGNQRAEGKMPMKPSRVL